MDKYISQVTLGAKTGCFTYIAHPDLINFTGDKEVYLKKMRNFITTLKELDIPLEFNFLGYTSHRNYPNPEVWKIIAEVGNRVVIGLDAHKPNVYSDKENLQKATEFLADLNITPINLNELKLVNYKGEYEQF